MQQHPIPQNISTYHFRLVGDMTIKQFGAIVVGILLAVLVYFSNLIGVVKWPLMLVFGLSGIVTAFVPIEERPLDQWIKAYIKAIYSPTQFIWRKTPVMPAFFAFKPNPNQIAPETQEAINAAVQRKQAGLSSFLQTLPQYQISGRLDQQELDRLTLINKAFAGTALKYSPLAQSNPGGSLHIDNLHQPKPNTSAPPGSENGVKSSPKIEKSGVAKTEEVVVRDPGQKSPARPNHTAASPAAAPQPTISAPTPQPSSANASTSIEATTSASLPFPSTPATPNTLVGMVLTPDEKIIENAIIEVRDQAGVPVRATKSNKLGQFFSTTPLKNGLYEIEVEKEGFSFDIIKLELKGHIVNPLKIQSK